MDSAREVTSAPSFTRYIAIFFATMIGIIALVWAYVASVPIAFMESGYASWAAKGTMLQTCQLGQIAFFGDSRLEAGFVPADFPVPSSNIGFAGGGAIEVRVAVDRALACHDLPRQAVITLVPEHFGPASEFYWLLSLRYGFMTLGDVLAVEHLAAELGDTETFRTPTPDGLSGSVRDWLYATHFPSLSFANLVRGRVFGRYAVNHARLDEMLRSRGWAAYESGGAQNQAAHPDRFILSKVQDAELLAALKELRDRGVATELLIMPFAPTHPETDAVLAAYRAHLADIAARSGAVILDPAVPLWPARLFADGIHLDAEGAHAFTRMLATCLKDGLLQPPCALAPPE